MLMEEQSRCVANFCYKVTFFKEKKNYLLLVLPRDVNTYAVIFPHS